MTTVKPVKPVKEQVEGLEYEDPFWWEEPQILRRRMVEFVPTRAMSIVEKLNAVTRFSVYFGLLLSIITTDYLYLYIPLTVMGLTYVIYLKHPEGLKREKRAQHRGGDWGPVDESRKTTPTEDNPFMNVLINEYTDNPHRPPAAEHDNPQIQQEIEDKFSADLYKDVDDIWSRNNSQRQFYTTPSTTIPNDRDSFMRWVAQRPYVCKDGEQLACTGYELGGGHRHGQL